MERLPQTVRLKRFALLCWGGTKPYPEAPTTTPLDSSTASGGEGGNTTGPAIEQPS
ncbi:hypothetical protein OZD62_00375 [Wolbachia endosymbiont of Drosophila seguyi]|nr:hypothetical protein [Wolbachia endosymbiont of Drosophila seguyi]